MEDWIILDATKVFCMISFFLMILIVGSLPIRLHAFHSNQKLLAMTAAFSGGLFLAVGMVHLLPEAEENFEEYYSEIGVERNKQFPLAFVLSIASFSLILFIEKIATTKAHSHSIEVNPLLVQQDFTEIDDENQILQEESVRTALNTHLNVAKQLSFVKQIDSETNKINSWTPYILQIAIGIHAVFEGLSIGIQTKVSLCIGIGLTVLCHKWAEGLTLGLAFRQAGVEKQVATIMIIIQAIMNPIGIAIGWFMSSSGPFNSGIFISISVGTFIYIATIEIIVEEFNVTRYKWRKFFIFNIAMCFVTSLWFAEQYTENY